MSEPSAERREQMLGLLAEKALALACAVQQRALEAESAAEMASLAGAFVKLSRATRQTIALHAKVEAERLGGERVARALAPRREPTPLERRQARVRRGVERLVWTEYDPNDGNEEAYGESLLEDLDDRLDEIMRAEAFLDADPDALIAQLAAELGLEAPPPPVRVSLPAPPAAPRPADVPPQAANAPEFAAADTS